MEQPWQEALDLDDYESDLPSLRRASSTKSTVQSLKTTTTETGLRRCSILSHSSQSIPSQSRNTIHQFQTQPPPSPSFPRVIPGPAGAVQSAMQRKRILKETESLDLLDGEPIPTQEYIRRAVEDGSGYDEDFSRDPWLCAVDFIRRKGMADNGVEIGMPLSSIKNGLSMYMVPQVVAMVKSYAPNGLGDMMVTLKDPTGTIGASIHRQVLTEGEFRKDITIGAVMILREVAVFSPSRSTCYLNITLANVVKVISRDSHTPLMQIDATPTDKHVAHGVGGTEQSMMPQKALSQSKGVTEEIMNSLRQKSDVRGNECDDEQIEEGFVAPESSSCNINAVVGKGPLQERRNMVHETEAAARQGTSTNGSGRSVLEAEQPDNDSQVSIGNLLDGVQSGIANEVHIDEENENLNDAKQRQPLNSRSSLPQWTDEQLEELFAFD